MTKRDDLRDLLIIGMVTIHCPACGEALTIDVRLKSISTENNYYLNVAFQEEHPYHGCRVT